MISLLSCVAEFFLIVLLLMLQTNLFILLLYRKIIHGFEKKTYSRIESLKKI